MCLRSAVVHPDVDVRQAVCGPVISAFEDVLADGERVGFPAFQQHVQFEAAVLLARDAEDISPLPVLQDGAAPFSFVRLAVREAESIHLAPEDEPIGVLLIGSQVIDGQMNRCELLFKHYDNR